MQDRSTVFLAPAAAATDANHLLAAIFGDPADAANLGVRFSDDGNEPATFVGGHIWLSEADAAVLLALPGGTLPAIDADTLSTYGLTPTTALAATEALTVSVMTGGVPADHLAGVLSGKGLQKIVPPPDNPF